MNSSPKHKRKIVSLYLFAGIAFLIGTLLLFPPNVFWQWANADSRVEIRNIHNAIEFDRIIENEKAVILLFVDWSADPHIMRVRIQHLLERHGKEWEGQGLRFYQMDVTEADDFIERLEPMLQSADVTTGMIRGGYGSMFWIWNRAVIDHEIRPIAISDEELVERIEQLVD